MSSIIKIFPLWHFSQSFLKKTIRWSNYVSYQKNGENNKHNKIRKQNVLEHTISKLVAFGMITPQLKSIFNRKEIDFELLWMCILVHDFAEPLRKQKFDILTENKVHNDDVDEYIMLKSFLDKMILDEQEYLYIQKAFLLQFAITSYDSFSKEPQEIMAEMRNDSVYFQTALLFQIIEKWEYLFYAHEHKNKHPTIWTDVSNNQSDVLKNFINKYPGRYQAGLNELFLIKI